ncbi:tissue factor pathway inhibitor isoform X1 [Cebus imitator]|uniref:Tissue factor pathway inhibitor n=2 Tax=Cebinae TaxID=38070 RepID=A0A2K5QA71_CEBIM|nr:tissue factor pathway inhibitor isoform X1 [Cebus imitator]XP_017400532.1 tissue factor pathway inhibitor isoform X1 [Cebus imitator]XP_017400534.1 tissue factor pathway inhibitor isoform X1 [Cebus imitator]XP_017400535.1 tissue factor pathway inhibitor isoform X1 [Cebus imitator]XP_017400536.1 tissue factor pathway inhibitor isoform X1 [Cebus imitator]XP_017400537.1 tissue factor pathway inhibitor isoform X1 [Cebus imitator]XP_017400538.1 tissue factor pathway inhibitor isoform X1 [Cebus 
MVYTMKKVHALWASICLLFNLAPTPLNADSEEDDEYIIMTDPELPPLKFRHTFCAYKADDGPCKAWMKRYFFNVFTRQCEEFIYGGCEGNQNRFDSLEECEEMCATGNGKMIKTTLQNGKPDFCFLEEDPGICRGYITRYFYNNQTKQCERFKYGGCLGNMNNFETLEECKNTCGDTLNDYGTQVNAVNNSLTLQSTKAPRLFEFQGPSWCLDPADRGLCRANETRFYYNSVIGKCRPFKYSGCGGNENNFTSKKECRKSCKKGFIQRKSKEGLIKTKRKRKKLKVKIGYEEIFLKNA